MNKSRHRFLGGHPPWNLAVALLLTIFRTFTPVMAKVDPDVVDPAKEVHMVSTSSEFWVAMNHIRVSKAPVDEVVFVRPFLVDFKDGDVKYKGAGRRLVLDASMVMPDKVTFRMRVMGRQPNTLHVQDGATLQAYNLHLTAPESGLAEVLNGSRVELYACDLRDHRPNKDWKRPGGVFVSSSSLLLHACGVGNNSDSAIVALDSDVTLRHSTFYDNHMPTPTNESAIRDPEAWAGVGAGVRAMGKAGSGRRTLSVLNCSFHDNSAALGGSAVAVVGMTTAFEDTDFISNTVTCEGGGVNGSGYSGGALLLAGNTDVTLTDFGFRDNLALKCARGAALHVANASSVSLQHGSFRNNTHDNDTQPHWSNDAFVTSLSACTCNDTVPLSVSSTPEMASEHASLLQMLGTCRILPRPFPRYHLPSWLRTPAAALLVLLALGCVIYQGVRLARPDSPSRVVEGRVYTLPPFAPPETRAPIRPRTLHVCRPSALTRAWMRLGGRAGAETRIEESGQESNALQESLLPADTTPDT